MTTLSNPPGFLSASSPLLNVHMVGAVAAFAWASLRNKYKTELERSYSAKLMPPRRWPRPATVVLTMDRNPAKKRPRRRPNT